MYWHHNVLPSKQLGLLRAYPKYVGGAPTAAAALVGYGVVDGGGGVERVQVVPAATAATRLARPHRRQPRLRSVVFLSPRPCRMKGRRWIVRLSRSSCREIASLMLILIC